MATTERRKVGASGVEISRVGLGGYELGPEPGDAPDVDRAVRVIESALAHGVNWLDTSENYLATSNEALIGRALERIGDDFLIASKVAPRAGVTGGGSGFRRSQVLQACRDSLQRLGRDHLDIYFLHWPDDSGVPLEETWGAMAELADTGLVRAIGLSNYAIEDVERCHAERSVDAVQVGVNLCYYHEELPAIARCGELGIAVTIFEPLASGILSGKTLEQVRAAWPGPWQETDWFKKELGTNAAQNFAVVDGLRPIAERLDATVAQVAIAWVLHQPGVTAAIAGSRNGSHMGENAASMTLDLSAVIEEIEQLRPRPVGLRPVLEADLDAFYEYQREPEGVAMAVFAPRERDAFVAHWQRTLARPDANPMTVTYDGAVAGNIGSWAADHRVFVGYWLGSGFWGKGIATAALAAYLADHEPRRPMHAYVASTNLGSIRVLEKCGFELVERSTEFDERLGRDVEELLMVLSPDRAGSTR